jgi:hypothetical protein
VLLENSDNESEAHARECFERCWRPPWKPAACTDAVVAENMAQAHAAVAHPRKHPAGAGRGRPEHQARHLDAVSRIPEFCEETDALLQREIPACGW